MSGAVQTQGNKSWQNGPLGCFADPRLCVLTFCIPCYTIGKNAEALGEDCLLTGLLACIGLPFGPVIRWRLRQERSIEGSMLMDVALWGIIPCCAAVQEAREIGWSAPTSIAEIGQKRSSPDQTQDMDRH